MAAATPPAAPMALTRPIAALDPRYVAAVLTKSAPGLANLPVARVTAAAIELEYADPAHHAARCSSDDAAVHALKGVRVTGAEQRDVMRAHALAGVLVRYALAP